MRTRVSLRAARLAVLMPWALAGALPSAAQQPPWSRATPDGWVLVGKGTARAPYLGRDAIRIHDGSAYLPDAGFQDGTIEFDIAPASRRGFAGVMFRMESPYDYEDIYFRPHKFGEWDAMQYAPTYHYSSTWQLYHGRGHTALVDLPRDAWTHVRIVVRGARASVFVGDSSTPVLEAALKRGTRRGGVGFWASGFQADTLVYEGNFANLRITPAPPEPPSPDTMRLADPRAHVAEWLVSEPLLDTTSVPLHELVRRAANAGRWQRVRAEENGLVNLNRALVTPPEPRRRVAFATVRIRSDRAQAKRLSLGYSDDVVVVLNSRVVYSGVNGYSSRYRGYLGLVSPDFDALYLPLRKGDNELLLAVRDNMAFGWGFAARLEDRDGIAIVP